MSTEIETKVSVRRNNGEIVSADVSMYNDTGDVVKKITIIDSDALASLEATISGFEEVYVDNEQLETILANINESTNINATKLNGLQSDEFSKTNHSHTNYAPTNHSSNSNEYGMGTTSQYGHVKTVNNLNTPSYISGESLSAYQGALLNNKVTTAESNIENLQSKITLKVGRASDHAGENLSKIMINNGGSIYAKITAPDGISVNNRQVGFFINGVYYDYRTNEDGERNIPIRLGAGKYLITVLADGFNGMDMVSVQKVIEVG